ncbi:hypothetical protein [Ruegeria sp. HKCCD8929]|uniref:hypothetical protein n=1 Tax=Ruegeria sp. HKCCD8929 TaxID=2683006 RepID=UPI00148964B7|nr:hypothetical protein [Ruegeria sp. HKCCD8929]
MVHNNKVLTVSYGTFSCTLEGFDDSFETMKSIAEYFRDLAADDRYFGSEPPQPDAEMLTRIAQRDIARQVEARQSETGIVLRATEAEAPAIAAQPQPAADPTPAAPQQPVQADPAPSIAPVPAEPVQPAATTPEPANSEPPAPVQAEAPQPAPEPVAERKPVVLEAVKTDVPEPTPAPAPEAAEPEMEAEEAPILEAEPVDPETVPAANSIAAKLQRIRAVVSRSEDEVGSYSEDEHADLMAGGAEEDQDAISSAFDAETETAADLPPVVQTLETIIAGAEPAQEDESDDILFANLDDDADEPEEDGDFRNILDDDTDTAPEQIAPAAESVIEMPTPAAAEDQQTPDGALTAEDEADLMRELAGVEAELTSRREDRPDMSGGIDDDADVSRLMDAADEKLGEPGASHNREAYTHLRAAVAATEADRTVGAEAKTGADAEDYREDLASVVNPRRPTAEGATPRPEVDKPGPLKLVAEQRIDESSPTNAGPVRPRRVASVVKADVTAPDSGFASFAEEKGAQSLAELLEAAAAYLSFVEGQEQFSRPQLMNKVRALNLDEFNREDSLRFFGQLLREGKIEKAGGGRFAASSQIGYRPNGERAVG